MNTNGNNGLNIMSRLTSVCTLEIILVGNFANVAHV